MKICILFSNYGPYHLARIKSFQDLCGKIGWSVTGIELARAEAEYPWKNHLQKSGIKVLSAIEDRQLEKTNFLLLITRLYLILDDLNPDVIAISGYARPAMIGALIWSKFRKKSAVLFSESKEDDAKRYWLTEAIKSSIITLYKSALVGGTPHQKYLEKLGINSTAIFRGYDVVDNAAFNPSKIKHFPNKQSRNYFLSINRFVLKKNLIFLIFAYADYRKYAGDNAWDLVLCGDGVLRPEIEKQIIELGLKDAVYLPGFLQQDELLPYFAHASCFIHASIQEQWGLVVNEAMAAGLPVLVSNRCGCVEDLVVEGINGFSFDPENNQQLTDLMLKFSSGGVDAAQMGSAALEHIQKFSPDYFATGLIEAVKYATAPS